MRNAAEWARMQDALLTLRATARRALLRPNVTEADRVELVRLLRATDDAAIVVARVMKLNVEEVAHG